MEGLIWAVVFIALTAVALWASSPSEKNTSKEEPEPTEQYPEFPIKTKLDYQFPLNHQYPNHFNDFSPREQQKAESTSMPLIVIVVIRVLVIISILAIVIGTVDIFNKHDGSAAFVFSLITFFIVFSCWWAAENARSKFRRETEERVGRFEQTHSEATKTKKGFRNVVIVLAGVCTILAFLKSCVSDLLAR